MVVPWAGFPLKKLLDMVEPHGSARYVAFETYYNGKTNDEQYELVSLKNFRQPAWELPKFLFDRLAHYFKIQSDIPIPCLRSNVSNASVS